MKFWVCLGCGCRYTAGAPRCPECPETAHTEVDEVPNITSAGVWYEPGKEPEGWVPPVADEAAPEPAQEPEAEAPAAPSPPRRVPPPAAG